MKQRTFWTILAVVCALISVYFLTQLLSFHAETRAAQDSYAALRTVATTPAQTPDTPAETPPSDDTPKPPAIDTSALRAQQGYRFWIDIPNTKISYPVMQSADNAYYLDHLWNGEKNRAGSLFLDWRNADGLMSQNAVVYGHNMKDGSMFADLLQYESPQFMEENETLWVLTDGQAQRWRIVSAHIVSATAACYQLDFTDDFPAWLAQQAGTAAGGERVLTLSTCTSASPDERMVVHAIPEDE